MRNGQFDSLVCSTGEHRQGKRCKIVDCLVCLMEEGCGKGGYRALRKYNWKGKEEGICLADGTRKKA